MSLSAPVLAFVVVFLFAACSNDDKKTVAQPSPDETEFSLPFASSFEEPEERFRELWSAPFRELGYFVLGWERDSVDVASGKYSLAAVRAVGLRCGGTENAGKQCFATEILRTRKPIDFTTVDRAELQFMNKRWAPQIVSRPSCWTGSYPYSGGNEVKFLVLSLSADQNPFTTVPWDWDVLATFTNGTDWKEESVDLSALAGKKAYLGFWEPDHCVAQDSTSSLWRIDEVIVQ
jgi:hypothetical protein